ncbi:MAG TPA: ATP-binding protein [Thermoanaerobaculia bacterium]|nr:ATP-binding protein [Thermoanaerobaculia bacterium]
MTISVSTEWQFTVDALDALIAITGDRGTVIAANESARQAVAMGGLQSLIGTPLEILRPIEPWGKACELAHRVSEREPLARGAVDERYSGRTWDVIVRWIPGELGEARILVMTDVTNMVALEASARRNELIADLGRLVGNVAHEVRNPLFSMSATLDAMEARIGTPPAIARYTDKLRGELRRITTLMQDLLEYGKPPLLEARLERVSAPLLDAISSVATTASARDIHIDCDATSGDGLALLDRNRMAQAFHNILENAVHYATPGSTVAIRLARTEVEGQVWVAASVEDDGPGFPEDVLPSVFEPFYTTRAGGTGLGLSIVQKIVQMHGGQAYASNRIEGGARVTICLPERAGSP